jgi:hypothetical protein
MVSILTVISNIAERQFGKLGLGYQQVVHSAEMSTALISVNLLDSDRCQSGLGIL